MSLGQDTDHAPELEYRWGRGWAASEEAKRISWHAERLLELGVDAHHAVDLATRKIDWHDVADLLRAGCPLDTAIQIVS